MPPHPLINFAIQKYDQNEPRFNRVYSTNNLLKINLDEYKSIRTQWIALCVIGDNVIYFDSLVVEHIPKEIKKFIGSKNITTNMFRVQAYDTIMCG